MIEIVDLNITNLCNARCPQCQRTARIGLEVCRELPLTTWSLEDFKNKFPVDTLDDMKEYSFCGTWGDPLMAKDIEKICHYIINNSKAKIIITTNGSIRTAEFYKNLGDYCGRRLSMVIDVDGIDEQMHQKYRRGTSLKKSLAALKALSQTKAIPLSQTVLFKHNEEHKNAIKKLCLDNGSHFHLSYPSDRFPEGYDEWWFINEEGQKESLEKVVNVHN
jgi:MoaA/NifB/PqqE/SkfB family radical SAM enzyme